MAKTTATKPTTENTTVENPVVEEKVVVEKVDEKNKKNTKETVKVEPLEDSDEIEVVSLIPNVSYKDSKTLDIYKWVKPNDDRVIKKFGLTKTFEKYEYLMDSSNYNKENIKNVCSAISDTPNGLKRSIYSKVKNLVISGEISDVSVIKELERHLKVDLISFL